MVSLKKVLKLGTLSSIIIILLIIAFIGPLITSFPPNISIGSRQTKTTYYTRATVFPENQTEIWVQRSVYISECWYVKIIDTINITNTKNRPFNSIILYYPQNFWNNVDQFIVTGAYKEEPPQPLNHSIIYLPKEYVGLKIKFYIALGKYSTSEKNSFKIYITFYMKSIELFKFEPSGDKFFVKTNITPGPYLPYSVKSYIVMIYSPDDPTISLEPDFIKPVVGKEIIEDKIVKYAKSDLPPMNMTLNATEQIKTYGFDSNIHVVWSLKNGTLVVKYVHRYIEIMQSNLIKIKDHIVVSIASYYAPELNPKKTKMALYEFRVGLAPNVTRITSVRDNIGKLSYSNTTDDDINETIRVIRVDLKTRPLIPGDIRDIYIEYEIQLNEKFLFETNNTFLVHIPLAPIFNTSIFIASLTIKSALPVKIILPAEYKTLARGYSAEKFFIVQYTQVTLDFGKILPYQNGLIKLFIDYAPLPLIRAYLILALYTIIVALIILEILMFGRILVKKIVTPKQAKTIAELERFIKAYETMIAYDKSLWGDAYNNLLVKRPTAQIVEDFRKKNDNLSQQYIKLIPLINKLKNITAIYDQLIDLEKIEERIKILKSEITNFTKEFLAGHVPTDIFRTRIEALLLELKDEIGRRERIINTIRDYYLSLI